MDPTASRTPISENNSAKHGNGGAVNMVYQNGAGASIRIRNTSFFGNVATGNGGALYLNSTGTDQNGIGQFSVLSTSFEQNLAGGDGGGLWASLDDGSGTAADPEQYFDLGPWYDQGPTVFIENTASNSAGGARIIVGDARPVEFNQVEFTGNRANDGDGGGVQIDIGDAGLLMSEVTIADNNAVGSGIGGGLQVTALAGGDVEARRIDVTANNGRSGGGMQIESNDGNVFLEYAQFADNVASTSCGGGLQVSGSLSQFGLASSTFINNSASGSGGLDLFSPGSENVIAEIKYSEFSGNDSSGVGGAMSLELGSGSEVFVENSTLSGNTAVRGGAINSAGGQSLSIKYATLAGNAANAEGGGLYTSQSGSCDIYNSLFSGNTGDSGNREQDLRTLATPCSVNDSLLSGDDSEFSDNGGNVLYQNALLRPLADNGGPNGRTHGLQPGSPAIDAGSAGSSVSDFDQRGDQFQRLFGGALDIGAYEYQPRGDALFSDRFESP